jgi:hypothetical protein
MHTVAVTHAFVAAAAAAGMTDAEVDALIAYLAENPMAGDVRAGTGGCRKLRLLGAAREKVAATGSSPSIRARAFRSFSLRPFPKAKRPI